MKDFIIYLINGVRNEPIGWFNCDPIYDGADPTICIITLFLMVTGAGVLLWLFFNTVVRSIMCHIINFIEGPVRHRMKRFFNFVDGPLKRAVRELVG